MNHISPKQITDWQKEGKDFALLDVREEYEHEAYNIGGILMPMSDLMSGSTNIPQDIPVIVYCEKGIRSVIAIQRLEAAGFANLYNLQGGMKAWKNWLSTQQAL